jgi:hypothetical protein
MHDAFCAQEVHMPLLQTSFTPHCAPLDACMPVSVHTGGLWVQSSLPVSHGFAVGVHAAPAMHAAHVPLSQTMLLVPHWVPLRTLMPVSLQRGTPVEQSVAPAWQVLGGVHALPAVQGVQVPSWQTSLLPHIVPFGAFMPVSVHVALPPVQSILPVWQALVGVHAPPETHASPPSPLTGPSALPPSAAL